ncbi:hypothetical protein DMC47_06870 [Nostoc sp. 3335mG]|nr:hypothetical protein DMC47_06870 [Nostoc sp. 3335mG]
MAAILARAAGAPAAASELRGPGRFCGYSPVIDLVAGERVVTLKGGIHSGSFRWEGPWGRMTVWGSEIGSPDDEKVAVERTAGGTTRYAERREGDRYVITIWNRSSAMARFSSKRRFTAPQLAAIDRVELFDAGQRPEGCNLKTIFVWNFEE